MIETYDTMDGIKAVLMFMTVEARNSVRTITSNENDAISSISVRAATFIFKIHDAIPIKDMIEADNVVPNVRLDCVMYLPPMRRSIMMVMKRIWLSSRLSKIAICIFGMPNRGGITIWASKKLTSLMKAKKRADDRINR